MQEPEAKKPLTEAAAMTYEKQKSASRCDEVKSARSPSGSSNLTDRQQLVLRSMSREMVRASAFLKKEWLSDKEDPDRAVLAMKYLKDFVVTAARLQDSFNLQPSSDSALLELQEFARLAGLSRGLKEVPQKDEKDAKQDNPYLVAYKSAVKESAKESAVYSKKLDVPASPDKVEPLPEPEWDEYIRLLGQRVRWDYLHAKFGDKGKEANTWLGSLAGVYHKAVSEMKPDSGGPPPQPPESRHHV